MGLKLTQAINLSKGRRDESNYPDSDGTAQLKEAQRGGREGISALLKNRHLPGY